MKLDFKKFKKICSDDKCTTLEHENGHSIKIAHKSLSPDMKKELDELPVHKAKGGLTPGGFKKVSYKEFEENMKASGPSKPSEPSMPANGPMSPKSAAKNYTEPQDQGSKPPEDIMLKALHKEAPPFGPMGAEKPHYPPCINPSCKSFGSSHPNCKCYGGKFAEGGKVDSYCDSNKAHNPECEYFMGAKNYRAGGMAMGSEESPTEHPNPQPEPVTSQEANTNPLPQPEPQAEPAPMTSMPVSGQDVSAYSAPDQLPQQATQAQPAAAPAPEMPKQVNDFAAHKEATKQQLDQENQTFESDLNAGHITVPTYSELASKGMFGKIGSIFGLLVGGAGSALAGQPNALLDMWNKEIERETQAQQNSISNKQNFYKINQENLMNQANVKNVNAETRAKAYALTQAQLLQTSFHKMVSDTEKLPDGPQKQKQQQVLNMLYPQMAQKINNINDLTSSAVGYYKTLFGDQGANSAQSEPAFQQKIQGMRMLGEEGNKRAEDIVSRHIPGVPGLASGPIPGSEKEKITSGLEFDRSLKSFRDWTSQHSGDLSPSDILKGQTMAADLQGQYRQATHGGVYKEGEQNFISKLIDETPTKFFNKIRVLPQLDALKDDLHTRLDQTLKNQGFQGYPGMKSEGQDQFKIVNGVKYKRGPNGEAIRVP